MGSPAGLLFRSILTTSRELDDLVPRGVGASRSQLIQSAVHDKLARLMPTRLVVECGKLDPKAEQAEAESWLSSEALWPAY